MEQDTIKRWEDLFRRGVIALERLVADAPPLVTEHRDATPENVPDPVTAVRLAGLEKNERLRNHHAGIVLKKLAELKDDSHPSTEHRDVNPASTPEAPHLPPILGLTPVQKTVVETARAMAAAESKADLVDWDDRDCGMGDRPPAAPAATAQPQTIQEWRESAPRPITAATVQARIAECPHGSATLSAALRCLLCRSENPEFGAAVCRPGEKPAGVFLRPTRSVEPLSWDDKPKPRGEAGDLRARLFALLRDKLGLVGEGAKLEARARCVVESVAKATEEDLRRGIDSLAGLPDYVAPALPAGPVAAYTAAAGIARGCSPELAAKLATLLPEDKAPSLAELTKVHSQPVLAAAKARVGIPAGSRAKDVGEARAVVMALPTVERPAPSRAEVLAQRLGGSAHAAAVGAELAAAEAGRTKGSAAADLCVKVCDLLKARLSPGAWEFLARDHEDLWDGDHPTLGGVLALVDDAPEEGVTT